ncbi:hypothetical protein EDC01DRAFT_627751 [Geopyxis carbonaria]|nr:hypothetical protein EDC01DRAFT_627751 [Geopyxis carbonaria]
MTTTTSNENTLAAVETTTALFINQPAPAPAPAPSTTPSPAANPWRLSTGSSTGSHVSATLSSMGIYDLRAQGYMTAFDARPCPSITSVASSWTVPSSRSAASLPPFTGTTASIPSTANSHADDDADAALTPEQIAHCAAYDAHQRFMVAMRRRVEAADAAAARAYAFDTYFWVAVVALVLLAAFVPAVVCAAVLGGVGRWGVVSVGVAVLPVGLVVGWAVAGKRREIGRVLGLWDGTWRGRWGREKRERDLEKGEGGGG